MDSDKSGSDDEVNQTKNRVVSEVRALDGMAWVTAGREVENYLSIETLRRRFPGMTAFPNEFCDIADALENHAAGEGKKFERNKVMFAETVIPLIERADLAGALDLEARIFEACKTIAHWNRIEPTWS
jgi:putative ATP-dependent endonuclease of the OLD family